MSTNTYIDPVLTTELREWVQNDTFVYEGSEYDVDVVLPAWNEGISINVGKDNGMYGVEPWIKGRVMGPTPPERLKKISEALKGKPFSAEHKRKLSENAKRRWKSGGNIGKKKKMQNNAELS